MVKMREKKNYSEQIFKSSADGILLTDVDGYITDVNKSFEEIIGYNKKEIQGRHTSGLLPLELENRNFTKQLIKQLKESKKKTATIQNTWVKKDGRPVHVELNTALLKNANGDIVGTISNVRDISVRVEIEGELKQRNQELLILNTIISFLNQFISIGELLDNALGKVLEIMKIELGAILLLDKEKKHFALETTKGFSAGFVSKISCIDTEENVIGKAVGSGDLFLLDDSETSKVSDAEWLLSENISSFLCLPIKTKKRVYGMMMFGRRYSRLFSEQDIRLLKNIGYQVALSIENALLYKEVRDSEEKYRLLTESANIGIISFTREGKIFQFNKKAEDIFGFSRKEIVNKFAVELLPEKHSQLIEKLAKKFMSSGKHNTLDQSIVEHVKGKGGTSIPIEISYSIWGERLDPIITATIRDMR